MKSTNQFRIVEKYESCPGKYYIIQELYRNKRGTRSRWRTWEWTHYEVSFDWKYYKLEDAQNEIRKRILERKFVPRIVMQIDAVTIDPDYAAALEEMKQEGIGIET